ncbi:MAG: hypothetical protein QOJ26_52, partial [Thermoplasmata archaeon]|nr:hypothetical protein [Thermoplasmata archaeon]
MRGAVPASRQAYVSYADPGHVDSKQDENRRAERAGRGRA